MIKYFAALIAALVIVATAVAAQGTNYGSYVCLCNNASDEVVFHNFKEQNCVGNYTVYTKPLGGCHTELILFSWNGFCNSTNMWYNNFDNLHCNGKSVLTRTYNVNQCFNCPNPECKNP